ncbi:alpha/beta hydrolase [Mycobacterium bourgelatii]|uniref:Xaa-Pro dipeptidyl-peptidase-like domain-containing protein n=1 Tax=Mycobacterium bourgelatii TaxID=1273442 RepID=A0A7I9YSN7_MYCBU|nr:CocE/NonD family hydrolase [Mycobacterium bourgelatii]MCV6978487.1 alpha/beta fold hydrolase [Mycobacterium bourgelatii]GFG91711.1 hypothetical protein MBOU_37530 [Mycobacterium bourgelatii]
MPLGRYEQHFAAAGIVTFAFDYRNLGASDGTPRQRLSLARHRQDIVSALDFVRGLPDIDAGRVGLWGTSLGAMHVLLVASRHRLGAGGASVCAGSADRRRRRRVAGAPTTPGRNRCPTAA